METSEKVKQFQKDVAALNDLLKGKKPFMSESLEIHNKMKAICKAYYGYVPSLIPPPWAMKEKAKEVAMEVWGEFGNVIVDEDDNIEQGWRHFPAGTSKFDVWHWIEDKYDVSIAEDLMNSITE